MSPNISETIPLVVVFAMYTSAVVGAVWLVVWGIEKLMKIRNNKTKTKSYGNTNTERSDFTALAKRKDHYPA